MNDYIKLKKRNIYRVGIVDEDGNKKLDNNGKELYLEFDLEDITTADKYNKCLELNKKALSDLQSEIIVINKKQDVKGKGFLTRNEQAKVNALKKYYEETEKAMDLFLGEGGTQKIFGDVRYLTMFDDLGEMLKPILPNLKINVDSIEKQIREKYKVKDEDVLKDEEIS